MGTAALPPLFHPGFPSPGFHEYRSAGTRMPAGRVPSWGPWLLAHPGMPRPILRWCGTGVLPYSPGCTIYEVLWLTTGPLQCPPKPHFLPGWWCIWGCKWKSGAWLIKWPCFCFCFENSLLKSKNWRSISTSSTNSEKLSTQRKDRSGQGCPILSSHPALYFSHRVHKSALGVCVYTHGILLGYKRDAFESVLMRWMSLEPIIQSEVNQKEKDKYRILVHIYGI